MSKLLTASVFHSRQILFYIFALHVGVAGQQSQKQTDGDARVSSVLLYPGMEITGRIFALEKKEWPFHFGRAAAAASWRTYLGEMPPPCTSQPDVLTASPLWRRRVAVTVKCCSSTATRALLLSFRRSKW